jgi:two-component system, cell cycle response regulator
MEICGNVDLGNGIYWIGTCDYINELHCNPYIIIDGDEGVLIDPGSVLDFEQVLANITSLIPLEKIRYVVLHHQDPDLCSSLPLFEKAGLKAQVVTHWRTSLMIKYCGINSDFYIVNEEGHQLKLASGRILSFIDTPYLHFPGAIATFDPLSGTLFSGDIFGAISDQWDLFADSSYPEVMKSFHEHYVPGNEIIRPVMELFLQMPITMICPQHGSIIQKDVKKMMAILRDLECGVFMHPIRKQISAWGGYLEGSNLILQRLVATYGYGLVKKAFSGTAINLQEGTGSIEDSGLEGNELWTSLFSIIYSNGGIRWLTVIEPLVKRLVREYNLPFPAEYSASSLEEQKKADQFRRQYEDLYLSNKKLKQTVKSTGYSLTKDPLTELYNERFFLNYLKNLFQDLREDPEENRESLTLLFIGIDSMKEINLRHGEEKGDEVIRSCAYLLLNQKKDNHYIFRLQGPVFAYIIYHAEKDAAEFADYLRNLLADSEIFLENITASIGLVRPDGQLLAMKDAETAVELVMERGKKALGRARQGGGNRIAWWDALPGGIQAQGKVLILENDAFHAELLKEAFETLSLETEICLHGGEALEMAESFLPDIIISEMYLSQADIFMVREALMDKSSTKDIPVVILSHQKDEQSVVRAINLGMSHYLKKPYMLPELLGITDFLIRKRKEHVF